jgi:phosphoribosyl 1,2-cyclic phosphate phosphodiesterase
MPIRLEVLGSGPAWPLPRLGCDCAQCTSDDPRDARLRSSILVDGRVLVDAGPDCYAQLRRAGAMPEAVVVTHAHHDHVLGLHDLGKLGRVPLHIAKPAERDLRRIFPRLDFRVMHVTPGVPIDLGEGLECRPFDVEHGSTPTLGLRFASGGSSFVYAPNLGARPASKLARSADLLILDGSRKQGTLSGHLSMSDGIEAARRLKPGRTLFTHIGHRAGTHAELEEWLPDGFGVAFDTQRLEL